MEHGIMGHSAVGHGEGEQCEGSRCKEYNANGTVQENNARKHNAPENVDRKWGTVERNMMQGI